MITLHGSVISNYYSKVKLALLEKGIPFNEVEVLPGSTEAEVLSMSPVGKIPFLQTPEGPLSESQAILDYLEAVQPQPALLPRTAYAAAKVKELCLFIDLNIELVVRPLYTQAFFGGKVSTETIERIQPVLKKNLQGLKRLARFAPYVAGDQFTQADCCAWPSLSLASLATKAIYGEDFLLTAEIDTPAYFQRIVQRPSAARVIADRKPVQEAMVAKLRGYQPP